MFTFTLVLAWSVTAEDARVSGLIAQMGDERFAVRTQAQAELERVILSDHGHLFRPRVEAARRHPDLEIARRAAMVADDYYNILPSGYPVLPWIDMLPPERADRQAVIDSHLGDARTQSSWGQNTDWPDYRHATYLYACQLLRQGHSRKAVRQLLDEMAAQERQYREKRGMVLLATETTGR